MEWIGKGFDIGIMEMSNAREDKGRIWLKI